ALAAAAAQPQVLKDEYNVNDIKQQDLQPVTINGQVIYATPPSSKATNGAAGMSVAAASKATNGIDETVNTATQSYGNGTTAAATDKAGKDAGEAEQSKDAGASSQSNTQTNKGAAATSGSDINTNKGTSGGAKEAAAVVAGSSIADKTNGKESG